MGSTPLISTSKNRAKARFFVIYASGWRVFDVPLPRSEVNAVVLEATRNYPQNYPQQPIFTMGKRTGTVRLLLEATE